MKITTMSGVTGLCILLAGFAILTIPAVAAGEQGAATNTIQMTMNTSVEFDGMHYLVKNADTGKILETMTPAEFDAEKKRLDEKYYSTGPDASGMITVYDRETGEVVGTGYGRKTT
jgi:hypothetical protein